MFVVVDQKEDDEIEEMHRPIAQRLRFRKEGRRRASKLRQFVAVQIHSKCSMTANGDDNGRHESKGNAAASFNAMDADQNGHSKDRESNGEDDCSSCY